MSVQDDKGTLLPQIVDNQAASRFQTTVDGLLAELRYRKSDNLLTLTHAGVPDEISGRGIAGRLVEAAVEVAINEDLNVIPACPYAAWWFREHPEVTAKVKVIWPRARQ
jgi:predicted GNAT family acetyltransferase